MPRNPRQRRSLIAKRQRKAEKARVRRAEWVRTRNLRRNQARDQRSFSLEQMLRVRGRVQANSIIGNALRALVGRRV